MNHVRQEGLRAALLFCAVLLFTLNSSQAIAATSSESHRVLLLHSYHQGLSWTDGITQAVKAALPRERGYDICIEYMDTKRRSLEGNESVLLEFYKARYSRQRFKAVIVSDNNALAFVRKHRAELFPETPVVFCGINNFSSKLIDTSGWYTGVVEKTAPSKTLALIQRLHPNVQRCVVIGDETATGRAEVEAARLALAGDKSAIGLEWWTGLTVTELEGRLGKLAPSTDAVLLTVFNRDADGRYFAYEESGGIITQAAPCPVYGLWDFYLGTGVVGGHMASAADQGVEAARLVARIVETKAHPGDIPIVSESPNRDMFDLAVLARHDIRLSALPNESRVFDDGQIVYRTGEERDIRLGVLAKRGKEICVNEWGPTADYLTRRIPGHQFLLVPLDFEEVLKAVQEQQIDFLITNSSQYAELDAAYGMSAMATLRNLRMGKPYTVFGGVVFTQKDRGDIQKLEDLKGKRFAAVDATSFGGWRMVWLEMKQHGIDPRQDFAGIDFAGTHDAVVKAVLKGKVDAGTVRTDTLERMQSEGLIDSAEIRVLHKRKTSKGFPFATSTALYPEWPLAKLPHVPDGLAQSVSGALISMPTDSEAAKAAHCAGWTIPASYQSVHDCLKQLQVGPYKDYGKVTLGQMLWQYWPWLLSAAFVVLASVGFSIRLSRLNHRVTEYARNLALSEERLDATLHSIGDAVVSTDTEGRVVDMNAVAETLTGWPLREARGKPLEEVFRIVNGHTCEPLENPVRHVLDTGETVGLANDTALIAGDGTERQIADSCAPIRDDSGAVAGAVLVFRDVTREYQQREQLREERERLDHVLGVTKTQIDIIDSDFNLHFVDKAWQKVYGDPTGRKCYEFFKGLDAPCPGCGAPQALKSRQVVVTEQILPRENNRIVEAHTIPYRNDAGQWLVAEFKVDITERKQTENALRESKERFDQLAEQSRTITWEVDANGLYTYVSHTVASVLEYRPEELVGRMHFYDLHPEAERDAFKAAAMEVFARRESFRDIENKVETKTGQIIWVSTNGIPVLDENENLLGYRGNDTDITERKKMQEAVRESEERLALATRGTGIGVWDYDVVNDHLEWDEHMFALFGVERTAFSHRFEDWSKRVEPKDLSKVLNDFHRALEGDRDFNIEFPIVTPGGEKRWLSGSATVSRDEQGQPVRVVGVNYDITARKRAEADLQNAHARTLALMESVQAGIVLVRGSDRVIVEANPAAARMAGVEVQDLVGKPCNEYICPAQAGSCPAFDLGQEVDNAERTIRRADGVVVPVLKTVTRINLDGEEHLLESFVDIAELQSARQDLERTNEALEDATARANEMAAEAEMANAAKSEFLANMSHEIRTPMNGIIGMTGLLLDSELSEDQRRYAEIVESSGESLLCLVNDILDFSKIEANKLDLETLDFDLQSLLDDFAATMALKAHEKGLELLCAADPHVPTLLSGDPGRLRQILSNLAGNAVKFTERGEVAVRVSRVTNDEDAREDSCLLRFSIRDTGIGIPADKIGMLFQQFTQVDASTTRKFGGTGLGLAISKQLAEMMGGEIGVESVEGQGSEFWFTARLGLRSEAASGETPQPAELSGVRVLIIDDNATSREILVTRLNSWGMRPEEANDGPSGLQSLHRAVSEEDPFRLAIVDMQMPSMDGESVGQAVKADGKIADTRLVMLTSLGMRGDAKRLQEIGFVGYAVKPVRHEELKGVLSQALADGEDGRSRPMATRHTAREALPDFSHQKARILLAEDNITNQKVALGILKKLGLSADAVANGREAIESLKTLPYDLILMDVQMPEMDGMEATRQIRSGQFRAPNEDIPIIAMTAHAMQGDKDKCLQAGMNDFVAKPVSPSSLAEALHRWLPQQESQTKSQEPPEENQKAEEGLEAPPVVFNRAGMLERLMGDEELANELIEPFLADMRRQIEVLRSYLESGDAAGAERQAHTIKGAAANMGGQALRALAFELEKAGKIGDMESMKTRLNELDTTFEELKQAMKEIAS